MKRILVPIDFSPESINAFNLACDIAVSRNAEVEMLHIIFSTDVTGIDDFKKISREDQMVRLVSAAEAKLENLAKGKEVKYINNVRTGVPFGNIAQFISGLKTDLIVMGTTGSSSWDEIIVGSNTMRVVKTANCPVITVRKPIRLNEMSKVAYALNFENETAHQAATKSLAEWIDSKICMVRVNVPQSFIPDEEANSLFAKFIKENELTNVETAIRNSNSVEKGLRDFTSEIGADMVGMVTHGRNRFMTFLTGSYTEDVVNKIELPVFTFNSRLVKK